MPAEEDRFAIIIFTRSKRACLMEVHIVEFNADVSATCQCGVAQVEPQPA